MMVKNSSQGNFMKSILIIEDEAHIADIIQNRLEKQGHTCDVATDGSQAIAKISQRAYDLATIDIMIPKINGLEVCDYLHKQAPATLLLVISSLDTQEQRLKAYASGADDFVGKPFSGRELAAKIEAQFRRQEIAKSGNMKPLNGQLHIDEEAKRVLFQGQPVPFTPSEMILFLTLAKHPNLVFSREKLSQILWDEGLELLEDRVIDSHIYHIRKKMAQCDSKYKQIIKTVRGFGYQLHDL